MKTQESHKTEDLYIPFFQSRKREHNMKAIRNFVRKYPILTGLLVFLISTFALTPLDALMQAVPAFHVDDFTGNLIFVLYDSYLIPLLVVGLFGLFWIYRRGNFFKTAAVGLAEVLFSAVLLGGTIYETLQNPNIVWMDTKGILAGLIEVFGIGFAEETYFRGIVANLIGRKYGKDPKGVWFAAIMSGLIFGFIHMGNMQFGVSFKSALIQSLVACGAGLLYAAIYYRGGSIWVLILNHFMTDAASLFTTLFTVTEATAASAVNDLDFGNLFPLFISAGIAIFLLRKSKIHEAVEMLNNDYDAANR